MNGSLEERYDAVANFSDSNNPSGPWSYGAARDPGDFSPFSFRAPNHVLSVWRTAPGVEYPYLAFNRSGKFVHKSGGFIPPDMLLMQPASRGLNTVAWCVVRFTAAERGSYQFRGRFEALSLGYGGTSQVILKHRVRIAQNVFEKLHGQIWEFDLTEELAVGEVVDFLVSPSPNGDNASDQTGLALTVDRYSGSWALPAGLGATVLAGLGGAFWWVRSRHKIPRK